MSGINKYSGKERLKRRRKLAERDKVKRARKRRNNYNRYPVERDFSDDDE